MPVGDVVKAAIMSSPVNPFDEIERFVNRMGRQFEEASRDLEGTEPFGRLPIWGEAVAVDVVESDEAFRVMADLPGYERDDVDIRVTDRTLRIAAEREATVEATEEDRLVRHERRNETVSRTIPLPTTVEPDDVEASMDRGVLHVTLPKVTGEEGREIEIAVE